jgi:putative ABC transport system permease protein
MFIEKPHLWLIRFIGVIVPSRLRADWRQEWEAELLYRETLLAEWDNLNWCNKLALLWHSLGAFMDALWLQPRRWEDEMIQDLRFGARMLAKNYGFTLLAIITLALGIGGNTAIFSIVNAVLLRPLPYHSPDRLARVWGNNPRQSSQHLTASLPDYLDWRDRNRVFEQIAAFSFVGGSGNLVGGDEPERVSGLRVSASLFPLLGAEASLGRTILPEDKRAGAEPVILLSHRLWATRFGSDPEIIGQSVTLSERSFTVVGIMPAGFQHPGIGGANTDVWRPLTQDAPQMRREFRHLQVVARLKPGIGFKRAQEEMTVLARSLAQQYPNTNAGYGVSLVPLHETVTGGARAALGMLLGAVVFVLLIACANVANLLMSRGTARQKEIAVRMALGAGRFRIVRQLLTESLLLSLLGGGAGLLLARWGMDWLVVLSADQLPRADQISIDGRVLAFTSAITILTGIIFGLAPALQNRRLNLQESLKAGSLTSASVFRRPRLRNFLAISEVALALMLLIGAGLLIKSFFLLQRVDPGLDPDHVLTMRVALPASKYPKGERMVAFYRELVQRVETLPGVRSAGVTSWLPMSGQRFPARIAIDGRPAPLSGEELSTDYRVISPGYFRALGASLLKGRGFSERDSGQAPVAVVINEAMANRFWPQADPLGRRVTVEIGQPVSCEVVGVIREIKEFGLAAPPTPLIYGSYLQRPWIDVETRELVIRTAADPLNLVAAVRSEARALDQDVPVYNVSSMNQILAGGTAQPRFSLILLSLFAGVALALAISGLYAVMAYSVSQRTYEISIRLALGAQTGDIVKLVLRQGLTLLLIGMAIGLAGAFALTRVLRTLLFEVSVTDSLTFVIIPLLLATVALLACWIPARRAMKVDPLIALRND